MLSRSLSTGRISAPPARLRKAATALLLGLTLFTTACAGNHRDQPYYRPLEPTDKLEGEQTSRDFPADTVARGQLRDDTVLYTGKVGDEYTKEFPFEVTEELLRRGQERYNISCVPCHGATGDGDGMIVKRGFKPPPPYHEQRLREVEVGYLYDVITNGYGAMNSYADQVAPRDRWAIVAYIRALQLSQNASIEDVPATERGKVDNEGRKP